MLQTPRILVLSSLIPFAKVADLLREVLPVDADDETIRGHGQATAERMEEELERSVSSTRSSASKSSSRISPRRMAPLRWESTAATCGRHTSKASSR
jgi:hypothetical protein